MNLLEVFLAKTYTKNQALRRLRLLTDILNYKIFKLGNTSDLKQVFLSIKNDYSKESFHPHLDLDLAFFESLPEDFFKFFEPAHVNSQLEELEKELNKVKNVLLYIPFVLPETEAEKIGQWFKQNLGQGVLFEVVFDPDLIGGCAISINGVYKDYSLKQKIALNQNLILEQLKSYKKT